MSKQSAMATTEYFVLLALAEEPSHGYDIAQQIVGDSIGGVYLRPSTLYSTLKCLEESQLIELWEAYGERASRKTYRLITAGKRQLAAAAAMHERAARLAKNRLRARY